MSKIVNTKLDHFPYKVKLRLLPSSWSFLANQKARNAITGAENLLKLIISENYYYLHFPLSLKLGKIPL